MDEVLAVGDMAFQKKCLEKMSDVSKTEGRTILYVSHNMNTIRQLCERCIVLDHGKLVFDGSVERAIDVYLGSKDNSNRLVHLADLEREPEFTPHLATMETIECVDTEDNIFDVGSTINLRLDCTASQEIKEAYMRIIIKNLEGIPVTMMTVDEGFHLSPDKDSHLFFSLDVSTLVPGKYTLSPVIYEVNELGSQVHLDGLKEVLCFEIAQTLGFNNNMVWQPRYWGYFYNQPIKIRER